jgi:type IV secretory pathway VirB6-like protein
VSALFVLLPFELFAQACTTAQNMQPQHATPSSTGGIVNQLSAMVSGKLTLLMQNMYETIIKDSGYQGAYYAAVLLSFTIYGVMILFNLASTKPIEIFKRLVKLSILAMFLNPATGWVFFQEYFVSFFWGMMNELLAVFNSIAIGSPVTAAPAGQISTAPLGLLNAALQIIFSMKFVIMIITCIFTSSYGLAYAILIMLAVMNIMRCIVGAVATYFKSMIALTFLFGLAPIFIPLVLFAETRKIFQGWLNQVINLTLQPIMLFAFISFFMVMIGTTLMRMMGYADFCWVASDLIQGAPQSARMWAPVTPGASGIPQLLVNTWDNLSGFFRPSVRPLDVVMLLVLSDLAWRYSKYISEIAKDFTGGALNLAVTGGDMRNTGAGKLVQDNSEKVLNAQMETAQEDFGSKTDDEKKQILGGGRMEAFSKLVTNRATFANYKQLVTGKSPDSNTPPAPNGDGSSPNPTNPPSVPRPNTTQPPPASPQPSNKDDKGNQSDGNKDKDKNNTDDKNKNKPPADSPPNSNPDSSAPPANKDQK